MEDKEKKGQEQESNAARRIRALDENAYRAEPEEPLKINKWENFWYHHKTKVIMIAAFTFIIGVAVVQFASHSNPDVSIIYAGPDYITANMNQDFCNILEDLAEDYDSDVKIYVQLNDMVFMTEDQIEEFESEAEASGDKGTVDRLANKQTSERFTYEIFGSEASICFLAEDQYEMVKGEGGFMRLDELLDDAQLAKISETAIDDYGVRFADTKIYQFYDSAKIFPEDTVLAIRKLSTMSALTGVKKAEKIHERSKDLFVKILDYEYPEGYTPPSETSAETENTAPVEAEA